MNNFEIPPIPSMRQAPQSSPQGPSNAGSGNPDVFVPPSTSNMGPSQESTSQWTRSIARSGKIKSTANKVIQTRSQFVAYLQHNGLDLWTSAIEFQRTGDFVQSSYIVYPNHNNFKERLAAFLQRYPNLQPAALAIRDSLRPFSKDMQVVTPKLRDSGL